MGAQLFAEVPAELTQRPVRLAYDATRVLGSPGGFSLTLVNYTMQSYGYHFDVLEPKDISAVEVL